MTRIPHTRTLSRRIATASLRAALGGLLCAAGAQAQPSFTLTDLGDLPGGGNRSWAQAINNLGQVVGGSVISSSTYGYRPYVWTPENGIKQLSGFGEGAGALEINDAGIVGGTTGCLGGCPSVIYYYGWRWQGNLATGAGTTTLLGSMGQPWGLNESGQFAGPSTPPVGVSQSFLATPNAAPPPPFTLTNLGHLSGGNNASFAHAVNEAGQVAGWATSSVGTQPYLWTSATGMQALMPGVTGVARGINDRTQVVGYLSSAGNTFGAAFLWSPSTGMITLGTQDWEPEGINNLGWVVGCKSTSDCGNNRNGTGGFLWTPNAGLHDLRDLIAADDPLLPGLTINNVPGLNDRGQIVINATRSGIQHAYLLTPTAPVPEPPAALLLALGALALHCRRLPGSRPGPAWWRDRGGSVPCHPCRARSGSAPRA
jgi:probable HAF family extracellular repeat protein